VTPVAIAAELASMNVIAPMTCNAGRSQWRDLFARDLVAGDARRITVRPIEHKLGPLRVIEVPDLPVASVMTRRTIDAEHSLVLVLFLVAPDALPLRILVSRCRVTGLAFDAGMASEQWKARLVVVKANRPLPVRSVVALLALPPQLLTVLVVLLVTCVAVRRELVAVQMPGVASRALRLRVSARQRVLRVAIVPKDNVAPRLFRVATGAPVAVKVLVRVVLAVAADAGLQRAFVALRVTMTVLAFDVAMLAAELEDRQLVVVFRLTPVPLGVAVAAAGSEGRVVLVVSLVAPDAIRGQFFADGRHGVAGLALCGAVLPAQRVLGVAVVLKCADVAPIPGGVANLAFFPEPATVLFVVLAVAADARRHRILENVVRVAVLARDVDMLEGQCKVRLPVVEARVLPAALRVAFRAFRAKRALVLVVLPVASVARPGSVPVFLSAPPKPP